MISVGDVVIWVNEDLREFKCRVTKIKRDNQLDLEYIDIEPRTIVTSGHHQSVQHPDYGCYWKEIV